MTSNTEIKNTLTLIHSLAMVSTLSELDAFVSDHKAVLEYSHSSECDLIDHFIIRFADGSYEKKTILFI